MFAINGWYSKLTFFVTVLPSDFVARNRVPKVGPGGRRCGKPSHKPPMFAGWYLPMCGDMGEFLLLAFHMNDPGDLLGTLHWLVLFFFPREGACLRWVDQPSVCIRLLPCHIPIHHMFAYVCLCLLVFILVRGPCSDLLELFMCLKKNMYQLTNPHGIPK